MEFLEVINKRHSVRKFSDAPVDRALIDSIIDVARTAPSSKNTKSTEFMVVEDADVLAAISEMRDRGSAFVKGAKAAIVVLGNASKTDLWVDNGAISATYIYLAATDLGLGCCWVHVNERPRVSSDPAAGMAGDYLAELLGVKEGMKCYCVMALGYPVEE